MPSDAAFSMPSDAAFTWSNMLDRCFRACRRASQHRQRLFGFRRRQFVIEISKILVSQLDLD
jgi:hypothetical protein